MSFNNDLGSLSLALPGFGSWDSGRGGLLIDSLLSEQGDLSAVERFAQFHEDADEPLQGRYYSALLPAEPAWSRPTARVRGRPRPLFGLQGVRGGVP